MGVARARVRARSPVALTPSARSRAPRPPPRKIKLHQHQHTQSLCAVAHAVEPYGADALFYLAAAVSDFYVPWGRLAEHKIQSGPAGAKEEEEEQGDGGGTGGGAPAAAAAFTLRLARVPKCIGALRREWSPRAAVVSFKLETDEGILMDKARGALDRYGVHAVVANLLHTRKDRVWVVRQGGGGGEGGAAAAAAGKGSASALDVAVIDRPPEMAFIEDALVANVVALHDRLRAEAAGQAAAA